MNAGTLGEAAAVRTVSPHPDSLWMSLMERGNDAFQAGDLSDALAAYLDGVLEAERLLRLAVCGIADERSHPAAALVVAVENAANVYARRQQFAKARDVLEHATELLKSAVTDRTAPPDVRTTCLKHMNRACVYLMGRMRQNGENEDEIARKISPVRQAAEDCLADVETTRIS
ncbi:MAG: hypothetical protein AAF942_02495 [Pseudomonadota bacterium]